MRYKHALIFSISGRMPGTRCSKLMGALAPAAPVPMGHSAISSFWRAHCPFNFKDILSCWPGGGVLEKI